MGKKYYLEITVGQKSWASDNVKAADLTATFTKELKNLLDKSKDYAVEIDFFVGIQKGSSLTPLVDTSQMEKAYAEVKSRQALLQAIIKDWTQYFITWVKPEVPGFN